MRLSLLAYIRSGLAALWGGGAVSRREAPYFPEASRLFFIAPHLQTGHLTQPYREHVWVYACVNAIAQSISAVPLLLKTGTRKNSRLVESHPLVDLFETPNPMMSGSQLVEATLVYLGLTGEAFYILDRQSEREVPGEIWVVHPGRFQEAVDEKSGLIKGWIYRRGSRTIPLAPHEVIFFRYFNPYNDIRGMSPLEAARAGVEQDYWAGRYNLAFFQNSAQPGGILETSGNLTDEDYQRLLAQWEDRHRGASRAHTIAILEGGLTYKQTGLSQKDMDFLEQRRWNREEILAAFKVPKTELGLYEDVNYATAKTQRKMFWETTLLPKMALIEYVLWSQMLRHIEGGRYWVEFDYASISALQEDRRELVESAQKLWAMGVPLNVVNEYLGLGLPEVAGGEVGYLPLNLTPVPQQVSEPTDIKSPHLPHYPEAADGWQREPSAAFFLCRSFDLEAYWKAFLAVHTPLEKMVQGKVSRYFFEQRRRQLRKLEEVLGRGITREVAVEALLLDLEEENATLKKLFWPLYLEAAQKGGEGLLVELGTDPQLFTLIDTPAMAALEHKIIKVVGINETVRNQLRATLLEGMGQMETVAELMARVKQVYNFAQSRSLTIARTEVGQSMGIGRDAAMEQMGVEKIRWVTAGDEHVRPTHQALNGMVIDRGKQFPNGCRFPSDPSGPAAEIINCFVDHQVPIFTTEGWKPIGKIRPGDMVLTHKNRFRRVTRLSPQPTYSGEVVRLIPAGDCRNNRRSVVTTPEHRFLMSDGSWKQAQHIQPGERIRVMASFCRYCGEAIPYWRSYCDHSCLSKAITKKQWIDPAHREKISRKTREQLYREYKEGIRDRHEITKKAREAAFNKYGDGGYLATVDRSPEGTFQKRIEEAIIAKWGNRLNMLRKTAFVALGKAGWYGSRFDKKIKSLLEAHGKNYIQQFFVGNRRVDFYLPNDKLFIECDTPWYHKEPERERKRDLEILTKYPDHQICHLIFNEAGQLERAETYNLLNLNHAGTYQQTEVEIVAVERWKLRKPRRLYNFAVEDDESYVAKGFISHNCRCVAAPVV